MCWQAFVYASWLGVMTLKYIHHCQWSHSTLQHLSCSSLWYLCINNNNLSHTSPVWSVLVLSPFYWWGNWGTEPCPRSHSELVVELDIDPSSSDFQRCALTIGSSFPSNRVRMPIDPIKQMITQKWNKLEPWVGMEEKHHSGAGNWYGRLAEINKIRVQIVSSSFLTFTDSTAVVDAFSPTKWNKRLLCI